MFLSQQTPRSIRQFDCQPIQPLRHCDLAPQPRGAGEAGGQVEHVGFVGARRQKFGIPRRVNDHMAGRTGHNAAASAFDIEAILLRDDHQGLADLGGNLAFFSVAQNEIDGRHLPILGQDLFCFKEMIAIIDME